MERPEWQFPLPARVLSPGTALCAAGRRGGRRRVRRIGHWLSVAVVVLRKEVGEGGERDCLRVHARTCFAW